MTYTTHAVSKLTGLSSAQLRYRIQNGEIKARKYKGRYRISEEELKKLMRKSKRKSSKKRTSKKRSSKKHPKTTRKTKFKGEVIKTKSGANVLLVPTEKTVSYEQMKLAVKKANSKNDIAQQLEKIRKKAKKKATSSKSSKRKTSNKSKGKRPDDLYLVSSRGNYVQKVSKSDANEFLMSTSGKKKRKRKW